MDPIKFCRVYGRLDEAAESSNGRRYGIDCGCYCEMSGESSMVRQVRSAYERVLAKRGQHWEEDMVKERKEYILNKLAELQKYADVDGSHYILEVTGLEGIQVVFKKKTYESRGSDELTGFWAKVQGIFRDEGLDWETFVEDYARELGDDNHGISSDPLKSGPLLLWVMRHC